MLKVQPNFTKSTPVTMATSVPTGKASNHSDDGGSGDDDDDEFVLL